MMELLEIAEIVSKMDNPIPTKKINYAIQCYLTIETPAFMRVELVE